MVYKTILDLINSNYAIPSLIFFEIKSDGSINKASQTLTYQKSSMFEKRKKTAPLQSANISFDGNYLFVQDLEPDKIHSFKVTK